MTAIGGQEAPDLASQIKQIRLFYAPLLERLYDNAQARLMDLEQLEWLATRFPDRTRFLAEIALDPPSYTSDLAGPPLLDEDFLILSTIHSAKGLQWDAVYVIHAADGNIPSDMATGKVEEIEEERRLFYVALTRAKDWLYVCHPLRYYAVSRGFSDIHGYAQLTRFLLGPRASPPASELAARRAETLGDDDPHHCCWRRRRLTARPGSPRPEEHPAAVKDFSLRREAWGPEITCLRLLKYSHGECLDAQLDRTVGNRDSSRPGALIFGPKNCPTSARRWAGR